MRQISCQLFCQRRLCADYAAIDTLPIEACHSPAEQRFAPGYVAHEG